MTHTHAPDAAVRLVGLLLSLIVVLTFAVPAHAHAPGVVLSGVGTATIDGVVSPGEWDTAGCIDFPVNVPEGGTTPGRVCAMNDTTTLYLLIRFARTVVDPGNTAAFEFDNDHDGGARVTGDDVLLINPDIGFFDEVRSTAPPCPPGALCGFFDTAVGGTNDGAGAFHNDGAFTVYEFAHPLNSADDANDFSLSPGDTVGFTLFIRLLTFGGFADTSFPTICVSCPSLFGDIVIASPVLPVGIDIKPGSFPNSINLTSSGKVPVAIYGTTSFDVQAVDLATVSLAGARLITNKRGDPMASAEDVDGDGIPDLVLHFSTQELALSAEDTEAVLQGSTVDGRPFKGVDSVRIVH